jgi:hypothetical protein
VTGTINGTNGFDAEYNAWVFDGSGDYISGTLPSSAGGDWVHSISMWFKADSFSTAYESNSLFYGGGSSVSANNMTFLRVRGGDDPFIAYSDLGANAQKYMPISTGVWYHVTATYSGGGWSNAKLYINSSLAAEGEADTTPLTFTASSSFYVAKTINAFNPSFNGSIANFRLYGGKALNADQIRELYEYDAPRFGHRQNLVSLHKGNLGVGVAHPTSRFEVAGADGLQEYPPKAMTGYETYMEGHGVFRASASSTWSTNEYEAFGAFNKTLLAGTPDLTWNSVTGGFSSGSDYAYTGTNSLGGISGEWLKLSTPYAINPSTIKITVASSYITSYAPEDFYLLGSVDDATWYVLAQETGETWSSLSHTSSINTTNTYKYFALVVTKTRGADNTNVTEMQVFGTPAPSGLEDGHLTLGKALTLPRVSGHPTGAETPRAESLVVHYDTTVDSVVSGSTVVDVSGNGINGTPTNGAAYSSTDRALVFDGTDDYVQGTLNNPSGAWVHSVSCWYKPLSTTEGIIWTIGTNSVSKQLAVNNVNGAIRFYIYGCDATPSPTTTFTTDKWHHIVAIFKNSETTTGGDVLTGRELYIDGVKQTLTATNTQVALNLNANTTFRLANQYNSLYNNGSISNFKIWGGVALTAEEVAMEYALGRTGKSLNLTDTSLCLGGTVPRAQLDVRGGALFQGVGIANNNDSTRATTRGLSIMLEDADIDNTDAATIFNYPVQIHNTYPQTASVANGREVGLCFSLYDSAFPGDSGSYTPGAAITHERTTSWSKGKLHFKTKQTNTSNANCVTAMTIRDDGNVGIGTTNPGAKLHIETSSTSSGSVMRVDASSVTNTGYSEIQMIGPGQTSQGLSIFCNGSGRTSDGGASATTVRNNNGPIILGNSSYVNRIRKPKDDDFICGKWTTTLDASAATTVITNLRSCVSTPSAIGSGMSGNIGRFTAPEDGYYFACCQVGAMTRNSSNLLIVYDAGGTNFATNNPNIGTYNEILDLRNADNIEETYNKVFVMHMEQNDYIQFRVHSQGYTENSVMQCYAYLLNRI